MSKIVFTCKCGKSVAVDRKFAGRHGRCPRCNTVVQIPAEAATTQGSVLPAPSTLPSPAILPNASKAGPAQEAGPLPTKMRANRLIAGKVCTICQTEIATGEEVRNCEHCMISFHLGCWNEVGGCGTYGCENSPGAASVPGPQVSSQASVGIEPIHVDRLPPQAQPSQQDAYASYAPRSSGKATASLVVGICGLIIAGFILGIVAIFLAQSAKKQIAQHPGMTGSGMATAGLVLGIIDLVTGLLICSSCLLL